MQTSHCQPRSSTDDKNLADSWKWCCPSLLACPIMTGGSSRSLITSRAFQKIIGSDSCSLVDASIRKDSRDSRTIPGVAGSVGTIGGTGGTAASCVGAGGSGGNSAEPSASRDFKNSPICSNSCLFGSESPASGFIRRDCTA